MGAAGAGIFPRQAQAVWPEVAPYFDGKALRAARELGLPRDTGKPAALAGDAGPAAPAAALVRVALDKNAAGRVGELVNAA